MITIIEGNGIFIRNSPAEKFPVSSNILPLIFAFR